MGAFPFGPWAGLGFPAKDLQTSELGPFGPPHPMYCLEAQPCPRQPCQVLKKNDFGVIMGIKIGSWEPVELEVSYEGTFLGPGKQCVLGG